MPTPLIQKQIQLPLSKALEIALKSLRVRIARSLLTLLTIAMAIAFLTNIWLTRTIEPTLRNLTDLATSQPAAPITPSSNERTIWLLSLSLLVCLVGITNAMLMSVMERYREIGTMKCLGALDSFILKLFFLESLLLGLLGTLLGTLTGILLTLLSLLHSFGHPAWSHFPWPSALLIALYSALIGLLITAAAALYPAYQAAKMQPIQAMRMDV